MIQTQSLIQPEIIERNVIPIEDVGEFDQEEFDLSQPSDFKKYITAVKNDVRGSLEYALFREHSKNYIGLWDSGSYEHIAAADGNVKKEIHHTPFSLEDIVRIVYAKRYTLGQDISVYMTAKEVMELHYKELIGVYPVTVTEHELVHNGYLFIPTDRIFGNYTMFATMYAEYIDMVDSEMKDTLYDIEELSKTFNQERQKRMLSNHSMYIDAQNVYSLPVFSQLKGILEDRVSSIKQNSYLLPELQDELDSSFSKKITKFVTYDE